MQNVLQVKVNKADPPNKAEILDLIWKGLNDGDIIIAGQATTEEDDIITKQVSDHNQAAGRLRHSSIPGL